MLDEPETMEVDLGGGVTQTMSKENAAKFIAHKDERTKSYNDLVAQNTTRDNAEKQAVENLKAEEEKRVAIEAAQKGQIDKLTEIYEGQLYKKDQENLRLAIKSQLATRDDMVSSAVPDSTDILLNSGEYEVRNGDVVHKTTGEAFDSCVGKWLESRPHAKASNVPKKIGGDSDGELPSDVETVTASEFNKHPKKYAYAVQKGTIKVI